MRLYRFGLYVVFGLSLAIAWAVLGTQAVSAQCFNKYEQPAPCPDKVHKPTATPSKAPAATSTATALSTPDCAQLEAYCAVAPPAAAGVGANPGRPATNTPPGEPPNFASFELVGAGLLVGLGLGLGVPPIVGALQPYLKLPGVKQGQSKGQGEGSTSQTLSHKHLAGVKYEDTTISETNTSKPTQTTAQDSTSHTQTNIQKGIKDVGKQGPISNMK